MPEIHQNENQPSEFNGSKLAAELVNEAEPTPSAVTTELKRLIQDQGKITFEEFMEVSLYYRSPQEDASAKPEGYYSSGRADIDAGGDFLTSPEASPVFGQVTAEQLANMWQGLGQPDRFDVVEMGAGNGTWAHDILEEITTSYPDLAKAVNYTIIEYSAGLITKQRETLADMSVNWVHGSAKELPVKSVTGVFVSNELPDAFPVHRVVRRGEQLKEFYVTLGEAGEFIEVEDDLSTPELAKYADITTMKDGATTNVNLAATNWIKQVGAALDRGYVLTIDYGGESDESGGAIRAYGPGNYELAELPNEVIYKQPGEVDITADVNFAQLKQAGQEAGLKTVFYGLQKDWLKAHHFDEKAESYLDMVAVQPPAKLLKQAQKAGFSGSLPDFALEYTQDLVDGEPSTFKVLIQQK